MFGLHCTSSVGQASTSARLISATLAAVEVSGGGCTARQTLNGDGQQCAVITHQL